MANKSLLNRSDRLVHGKRTLNLALVTAKSVLSYLMIVITNPISARYALITELSKTLKREILLHLSFWIFPCL